jgi:hypothetical protein
MRTVLLHKKHCDSSSDERVIDLEESYISDDKNSDSPSQRCARPDLRNLKWIRKLGKPNRKLDLQGSKE